MKIKTIDKFRGRDWNKYHTSQAGYSSNFSRRGWLNDKSANLKVYCIFHPYHLGGFVVF